jgi:type III secretion system FlhB-like substrate exporter
VGGMRVVKLTVMAMLAVMVLRYAPVYYHTWEFNRFVQEQVPRIRSKAPLREAILTKAEEHNIPITAQDISMTTSDSVLRVNVEYQVPVNFYLFHKDFSFHAMGSGLLMKAN